MTPTGFPQDGVATSSEAEQKARPVGLPRKGDLPEAQCRALAEAALQDFGSALPPTRGFELYLVRALCDQEDGTRAVIYQTEFLFILDVGLESLVGVTVPWKAVGYGDPTFPDFAKAALRSVRSRAPAELVFPGIAGKIIVGVKQGTPPDEIRRGLEAHGLKDVTMSPSTVTARCLPFRERAVCTGLERALSFVKYAQPNHVIRLVDFQPGWTADRLA
ncbi:MAG TPA: hypothetical protein VEC60_09300 [Reyranella sp.]|nr:hypothetical protein [Reyranella sp.]